MLLQAILTVFDVARLAVRSSAWSEDRSEGSNAGRFKSLLDVPRARVELADSIDNVIQSLPGDRRDEVLIQEMVTDIGFSGVASTYDPKTGGPYYLIEFDDQSGRSGLVTGGRGEHKAATVHHDVRVDEVEPRLRTLLHATRQVRDLWRNQAVQVEFAQRRDGTLFLLQARPVVTVRASTVQIESKNRRVLSEVEDQIAMHSAPLPGVAGSSNVFGQMPDWNPAELIGPDASPLSFSLFSYLITDRVWEQARVIMGYQPVKECPLMLAFAGHPYIDVRASFNSFLPAGLPMGIRHRVVNAWLQRLRDNPHLHDKVEFDVAQTFKNFSFEQHYASWYPGALTRNQYARYRSALAVLTDRSIDLTAGGSLQWATRQLDRLRRLQAKPAGTGLQSAFRLLDECRDFGTLPFATIARHAFIAKAMLNSAVEREALTSERIAEFERSLVTVVTRMRRDFFRVWRGTLSRRQFLQIYGHLRPSSFDITSPRYDACSGLFGERLPNPAGRTASRVQFRLTSAESRSLDSLIRDSQFRFAADDLLAYASAATKLREEAKFVFTRHLSNALDCITGWRGQVGLELGDVPYLTLIDLVSSERPAPGGRAASLRKLAATRRRTTQQLRAIHLPALIRSRDDLYISTHYGFPNFVTNGSVIAPSVRLEPGVPSGEADLSNLIVCLQRADPGFDWIFTRNIAGLVTQFGGANSHMAVRCAELGIPAAIGVGEVLFERLSRSRAIELRCAEKMALSVSPGPAGL